MKKKFHLYFSGLKIIEESLKSETLDKIKETKRNIY